MKTTPLYSTKLGNMYWGDSRDMLGELPDGCANLVLTSPPYALHFQKEYGNVSHIEYINWIAPFLKEIKRVMGEEGSFVLNIGGVWQPGAPIRSLYQYELVLYICRELEMHLAQEFFWYNPAKMPAPAEWVNVRRLRVKDSVEYIFWFVKDPFAHANNRKVLQPYSKDMQRLIRKGLNQTVRPSGHVINSSFVNVNEGSIPGNLIQCGNNESNSAYIKAVKAAGEKVHPARFPAEIPRFFIEFLTMQEDTVLDPFAGSNTTGWVAEALGRRWIAMESDVTYAKDSIHRFSQGYVSEQPNQPALAMEARPNT